MSDRTHPIILDHFNAVVSALNGGGFAFPIGEWDRPKDANERFVDPPYAVVRVFPSTGQFEGPLTDSQIDTSLRIQIQGVGLFEGQALRVVDLTRTRMKRSLITVPGRYIQDVRFMVVSGGASRDDDLPTPFFYAHDIYEILTTPA